LNYLKYFINLAGLPATIEFSATSLVTILPAPTTAFLPIVTPANTIVPEPIQTPSLITIGPSVTEFYLSNNV
jgi:hypothetical protein